MENLSSQVVENVFPEERARFWAWLRRQRKRRVWLIAAADGTILAFLLLNVYTVAPYLYLNAQLVLNWILLLWSITVLTLPFMLPLRGSEYFSPSFSRGLDPRVWDFDGMWRVDPDEHGRNVLTITDSNRGGLAIPCLQWTDYELTFETRMLQGPSGWFVRATSLNDYVMQKLDLTAIVTFYAVGGILLEVGRRDHAVTLSQTAWIPIRVLARGNWLSVYVTSGGQEHLIFQDEALGIKRPISIETKVTSRVKGKRGFKQVLSPSYDWALSDSGSTAKIERSSGTSGPIACDPRTRTPNNSMEPTRPARA